MIKALFKTVLVGQEDRWLARGFRRQVNVPATKRLLFVGDLSFTGGTFTFFSNAVAAWKASGWQVECGLRDRHTDPNILAFCEQQGVPTYRVWGRLAVLSWKKIEALVRTGRYTLVVGSGGGLDFYDLLLALPVPVVLFFHTVVHQPLAERDLQLLRRWMRPEHRLVGVSRASLEGLRFHGGEAVPERNARYLYNYVVDRRTVRPPRDPAAPRSVVSIGHATAYKNVWLWIDLARAVAARMVPGTVTFTWVGGGDALEDARKACADQPALRFVGFHRDVDPFLADADLVFHPSRTESFGLAVAEGMMWGVPAVVSDAGALPELVEDGVTGLVFPLADPDQAVDRLVRLLSLTDADRQAWGARARSRYEALFTQESWRKGFASLITEETAHEADL